MKTFIISTLLILSMVSGAILYSNHIMKDLDKMSDLAAALPEAPNECEKEFEKLCELWDKNQFQLSITNDFKLIKEVSSELEVLKSSIKHNQKDEYFSTKARLQYYLKCLRESQSFDLKTIV